MGSSNILNDDFIKFSLVIISVMLFIVILAIVIKLIIKAINYYPGKTINVDITRKNKMDDNDLIDYYIINFGIEDIVKHIKRINEWKKERISKFKGNKIKESKFNLKCDKNDYKAFLFVGNRTQTRYRQVNYVKQPYQVVVKSNEFFVSDKEVLARIRFLEENNYNVTYNNYNKKDQRKAMTKELREIIKTRDNYTCQICGKYMPDEVGLHIDHIISIKNGGKSVPENLRVLCSKCNGKKGGK